MAVALAASYNVNASSRISNQTITTPSFTPTTGEVVVLKAMTEDQQGGITDPPSATGGGITWVKRAENNLVGNVRATLWTGVVTAGGSAITVSVTTTNSFPCYVSMVVERWTGAQIARSPSIIQVNGTGAPSGTGTVLGSGSIISYLSGDWVAASGTVTYTGGATQDGTQYVAGAYGAYYAYQTVSAGSATIGLSAPTGQTFSIIGIEVQVAGQANPNSGTMMTMGVGI